MLTDNTTRISAYEAYRDMFLMAWNNQPSADWIRKIVSPDAFDGVIAIWRLMVASGEPTISVPGVESEKDEQAHDDLLERALRAIFHRAQRNVEVSLVGDLTLSAAVDGVAALRIGNSADVVELARSNGNEVLAGMAEQVPFTFDVLDPGTTFVDYDNYGIRRALIIERMPAGEVREFWGKKAEHVTQDETEEVEVYDWWDRKKRCVWVKDAQQWILFEEHELPFIPIVRVSTQATTLWRDRGRLEFPLLYPLKESGMFEMHSLALTMAASTTNAMGSMPFLALIKSKRNQPDPTIDWSKPGVQVTLEEGQDIKQIATQAIPEAVLRILEIAENKGQEMVVPKVIFGQAPSGSIAFSALNLLSQAGRLPVVPIRDAVSRALSSAFEIVLRWIEHAGAELTVQAGGTVAKVDPGRIDPATVWVDVEVSPALPQDRASTMNAVSVGTGAGIISRRTARTWLNITDSTEEQEQILLEKFMDKYAERFEQEVAAEAGLLEEADAPAMEGPEGLEGEGLEEESTTIDDLVAGIGYDPSRGGLPPVMGGQTPTVPPMMPGQGREPMV
jgi:hypothetical protein